MAKKHVILFAGTTEGRILANWLDEQSGVTGIVCVATEYGAELLEEEMSLKHLTVHCGRLDEGAMEAFLKKESPSLVIDATHPYAQVVTANIRKACEKYPDICLLRCLRKESEDEAKDSKGDKNGIIHVKNTAEAVRYLPHYRKQGTGSVAGTSGTFRTDFCKSPSCGSFCSYLQGTGLQRKTYHCHAGTVFSGNELYTIEGISMFLYGNKGRGRYRRL